MQTMIRKPFLGLIVPLLALVALAPAATAEEALLVEPTADELGIAATEQTPAVEPATSASRIREVPIQEVLIQEVPAVHLAALEAFTDPNAWRVANASDASLQQNQSSQGGGGFGRWIKKRWYIPVLAAVVLGVTLADDSDSGEEEDE